ncbi:2-octaprenyl-3-methyl-6-methoxy-1,4-benzoquinol hydroxylase [Klebsiella pneumoniae subsp. pneumoniae]|nr:2-octaprenyl-3-methyl-6-methoxy-1,4-benzoquinol hydroxylase [Klebsiella pneumoniae subsp. pneumoniae]
MTIHVTDVAIVGGGMVGGALALGLAQQGFTVTVLEKAAPPAFDPASAPDVRISAISAASVGLLKSLGVWDAIRAMRVHAYRRLETWGVGERARRLRRRGAQAAGAGLYGREQGSAMGPVASAGGA